MKKSFIVLAAVFILLAFGACSPATFDGSRTENESRLIMEYKVLNTTDSQTLELLEGDKVDFAIVSDSGKVGIVFQKEGSDPVYEGNDIPTSAFQVVISEAGSYTVSVTGKNAKGSVSIVKV
jgi:hypothetical protein